jgi:hypothetical protein
MASAHAFADPLELGAAWSAAPGLGAEPVGPVLLAPAALAAVASAPAAAETTVEADAPVPAPLLAGEGSPLPAMAPVLSVGFALSAPPLPAAPPAPAIPAYRQSQPEAQLLLGEQFALARL